MGTLSPTHAQANSTSEDAGNGAKFLPGRVGVYVRSGSETRQRQRAHPFPLHNATDGGGGKRVFSGLLAVSTFISQHDYQQDFNGIAWLSDKHRLRGSGCR